MKEEIKLDLFNETYILRGKVVKSYFVYDISGGFRFIRNN